MSEKIKVVTPEFRADFVNVFEPSQYGKKQICMIFNDPSVLKPIKAQIKAMVKDHFKDSKLPKNFMWGFNDGDEEKDTEKYPHYAGAEYMNAKTGGDFDVTVIGPDKQEILDTKELYNGCVCRAVITLNVYKSGKNEGVNFYLNAVQKIRDEDKLGGGGSSYNDMFETVTTVVEEEDEFDI